MQRADGRYTPRRKENCRKEKRENSEARISGRWSALAWTASSLVGAIAVTAAQVGAQEEGAPPSGNILTPSGGLIVWTLVIFGVVMFVLSKWAFKPITAAVAARERSLEEEIEQAKRDRTEAANLLTQQRQLLEHAQADAQKLISDARGAGDRVRQQLLDQAHAEQQQMLERARKEIDDERQRAIADLRREAVDLAIVGAGKVIEKNLDDQTNRKLVEQFLATITPEQARR
jgi:F-type H+-transporting ATPase subunit b